LKVVMLKISDLSHTPVV